MTLPRNKWNARKHGGAKRRLWRKIHIGIDEKTLEIRAIEATSSSIGDAPVLPDLLNQIPPDGAYDTRKCYDAIAAHTALDKRTSHTSHKQRHEKWHEHKPDAS